MIELSEPRQVARWCAERRAAGRRVGFVPTMGYLHEGHLALIRRARELADVVVVSIFVNPLQFGPREDLERYPRDPQGDARKCRAEGVDLLFVPDGRQMYPTGFDSFVDVRTLGGTLCGARRPGHFQGVCTVVTKLFNVIGPCAAVFGEKDFQQLAIIRRMVLDLNQPVEVIGHPTVREADGLALSSRNAYLSPSERSAAAVLNRALSRLVDRSGGPIALATEVVAELRQVIEAQPLVRLEYVEVVDKGTLQPLDRVMPGQTLVAVAATVGTTRLIDNIQI